MKTQVSGELVEQVMNSVFSTMLGMNISSADSAGSPQGERVTAAVYFEGEWNGAVLLECNLHQACRFTGLLLGIDPPEEFNDDVRDAFGELANMICGNIKSAIAPGDQLSLPSVIHGNNFEVSVCGSEVHRRAGFSFDGGQFWVTVLGMGAESGRHGLNFRLSAVE